MAKSVRKITLSQSRDIPFNRLVLSQAKQLTPALQVFLDTASQVAAQPPARNRR